MKLRNSIVVFAVLSLMMACSESIEPTPYTFPRVFTGETVKGWTVRSVQFVQEGRGTQTLRLAACAADDVYVFYNNPERTYIVNEGATKCSADDPFTVTQGAWSFVNSSATLTIVMPVLSTQPLPFIVKEVEENIMVLDIYLDNEGTQAFRFNFRTVAVE